MRFCPLDLWDTPRRSVQGGVVGRCVRLGFGSQLLGEYRKKISVSLFGFLLCGADLRSGKAAADGNHGAESALPEGGGIPDDACGTKNWDFQVGRYVFKRRHDGLWIGCLLWLLARMVLQMRCTILPDLKWDV